MQYTFQQFIKDYPDDESCLDAIMELRFGKESTCPGCGVDTKFHRITKRRAYACQHCGHHVYPCAGTPFEKSRTSLQKWFYAMYLFTATRHGVPAKELERQLGVTYKTAWRIAHELRKLMAAADEHRPLMGRVELDETFIGGKSKQGRKGWMANKTIVFGMYERDGILRTGPIENASSETLHEIVRSNVIRRSKLFTDYWRGYQGLGGEYTHQRVNHEKEEWVRGEVHTNTLEGFWSHFKRSIKGTHVHVSKQHMWKYASEFTYRYNMCQKKQAMFPNLFSALALPRVTAD